MAGSISGRVANNKGVGVGGAQVKATDGQNNVAGQAVTLSNGSYAVKNLAAGAYTVSAQAPLGFKDPNPIQNVQVVDGQDAADNNFQIAAASVLGLVTDKSGNGVQGKTVKAVNAQGAEQQAQTDANGRYMFDGLAAGKYTIRVDDQKFLSAYNVEVVDGVPTLGIDFSEDVVKDFLDRLDDARFSIESLISKDEANQAVSLFSVVNLMLAGLSRRRVGNEEKMDMLGVLNLYYGLQEDSLRNTVTVANPTDLWFKLEGELKSLARDLDQLQSDADFLNREAKRQFNLGLSNNVLGNVQFPPLFRRYVEIGADKLIAFDIKAADENQFFDKTRIAEADELLKELKGLILQVVRLLSKYGTAATRRVNEDWARFEARSLEVLSIVARDRVTPDQDERNVWTVLADLTGKQRETEVAPYVVLSRHGGKLLTIAMDVYRELENKGQLDVFDPSHLRDLFQRGNIQREFLTEKIREQATVIKRYPLASWG